MLLNFRVSNYRSFRDEVSVSFIATRLDKGFGVPTVVTADGGTVDVLPVVAVLGANASGKSNLLRAMQYMRTMVLTSASKPRFEELHVDPFLLDPKLRSQSTLMELDFVLNGSRYVYGFELTKGRFTDEWLHTFPHKRSQNLFDRENVDEYQFGKNLGGQNKVLAEITRPQVLFLSAAAQAGHPLLSQVYDFFADNMVLLDVPGRSRTSSSMVRRLTERRSRAVQLLALADLGILDARIDDSNISEERRAEVRKLIEESLESEEMSADDRNLQIDRILNDFFDRQEPSVELVHKAVRGGTSLPFEEESLGTKSWLSFVSHALDALEIGGVLLVDELDASLHPLLIAEALQLFQSRRTNQYGAQLVFTTHDVTLLSNSLERLSLSRGQVWLVEKSDHGASTLTPLSDYRPRKGEDLARGYLQGRYGGTPRILPATAGDLVVGSKDSRGGALTRPVGTRLPKKRVVVVCEGAKTEPSYLRLINRRATDALVELEIVDEAATSPKQLVERACEIVSAARREVRRTRDPNAQVDEIWCVFDVDEHPMLREAKQQAEDNGVSIAISNPSFEIWLLLHFVDQTAYIHRDEVLRLVKAQIADYDKCVRTLDELEGRYGDARQRAQRLDRKHAGDETAFPQDNPASGMWRLVDSLQAAY